MTYFKIRTVHLAWLDMEIAKGKIFYHKSNPPVQEWVPCGACREDGASYDSMMARGTPYD